jgi:tellurite resistance protein
MSVNLSANRSPRTTETKTDPVSSRIPLNTLAIPFGLIGYAGTWNSARAAFGWGAWVTEPFWIVAAAALIWLVAAHTIRGHRTSSPLSDQLKHPAQGPIAAILPASVVLLGAHLHPSIPLAGEVLVYAGSASGFVYAAWLIALWIRRQVPVEAIHGGYFLPTVAAGYISAGSAAAIGNTPLAIAAFSMGTFFWAVIFIVLLARLALVAPLPGPLTPTLAILAAPPSVGGMAWLAMNGRTLDWVTVALFGSTIFMMLIQIALIPTYRRLQFTLGFWAFTFSMAAVASQVIVVSDLTRYPGWQIVAVAALVAVSALILTIAIKSLTTGGALKRGAHREERQLARADDLVAHPEPPRRA